MLGDRSAAPPLARYEGTTLGDMLNRPGTPANLKDKRLVGPGLRAILFVWVTLESGVASAALRHRLTFNINESGSAKEVTLEGASV